MECSRYCFYLLWQSTATCTFWAVVFFSDQFPPAHPSFRDSSWFLGHQGLSLLSRVIMNSVTYFYSFSVISNHLGQEGKAAARIQFAILDWNHLPQHSLYHNVHCFCGQQHNSPLLQRRLHPNPQNL